MTVQMTVRLPDDIAAFVDRQVEEGTADSRAAAITAALRRMQRSLSAQRDAQIYAAAAADADADSLAAYAARQPMDID
ncbi:ribbon-helix-helix domain-containing protein [Actinoplanes sp. NPDC051475]|uniref:ribbon-helix-helix domain-containing protein n=1 Tax=Actinoplanes sp. NPDC051475 TaxID=3157225 RepID=UPI00344B20A6